MYFVQLMKIFVLFFSMQIFSFFYTNAQNFSGQILSKETKKPIPFASVYYANTSIGVAADQNGHFILPYNLKGNFVLCASAVGYEIYTKDVTPFSLKNKNIIIYLKKKLEQIDDVDVIVNTGDRAYNMKMFKHFFLGNGRMARASKIKNEQDIFLYYNRSANRLTASAKKPIRVKNKLLGYEVDYYLKSFKHNFKENYTYWEAFPYFKDLKTRRLANRIRKNRELAYKGSIAHLIKALYNTDTNEFKFFYVEMDTIKIELRGTKVSDIYGNERKVFKKEVKEKFIPIHPKSIVKECDTNKFLNKKGRFAVLFSNEKEELEYHKTYTQDFQFSYFTISDKVNIFEDGRHYPFHSITFEGYMPWEINAPVLPIDYENN